MCGDTHTKATDPAPFRTMFQLIEIIKTELMTDYMKAGNELPEKEPDPFDSVPFKRIDEVKHKNGDRLETVLSQAKKIHRTAKRNGSIGSDKSVIESLATPTEYTNRESYYAYRVGPVAETCDVLEWKSAYRMDIDEAVSIKSEEFREAASQLNIPNSVGLKLAPEFVKSAYRILKEHTEETGRPMHPYRLRTEANVILAKRSYSLAFSYLNKLPGVIEPTDGPAWEFVEQQTTHTEQQSHV